MIVCTHGQQASPCPLCEKDMMIAELKATNQRHHKEYNEVYKVQEGRHVQSMGRLRAELAAAKKFIDLARDEFSILNTKYSTAKAGEQRLREALNEALASVGDACHSTAIYGDQPPQMYLDALDKGNAALKEKP